MFLLWKKKKKELEEVKFYYIFHTFGTFSQNAMSNLLCSAYFKLGPYVNNVTTINFKQMIRWVQYPWTGKRYYTLNKLKLVTVIKYIKKRINNYLNIKNNVAGIFYFWKIAHIRPQSHRRRISKGWQLYKEKPILKKCTTYQCWLRLYMKLLYPVKLKGLKSLYI